jgi:hypothetical protein
VTEFEYQKELLRTKIDAHRTILGLEVRAARAAFDPLGAALSMLGASHGATEILLPLLRAVGAAMGAPPEEEESARSEGADSAPVS